jgi:hypothetical protein
MVDRRSIYLSRHVPAQAAVAGMCAGRNDAIAEIQRQEIESSALLFGIGHAMRFGVIGSNEIGLGIAAGLTASCKGRPS